MFIVIKILIVAAALTYLFWDIDFVVLGEAFGKYDFIGILLAQVVLLATFFLVAYRLRYLTKMHIPYRAAFEASMFGLGINNILPAKIGELAKGVYLDRIYHYPLSKSLALIVIERLFDIFMMIVFALALTYFIEVSSIYILLIAFALVLLCLASVLFMPHFFIRLIVFYAPKAGRRFLTSSVKTVARIAPREWNTLFWLSLFLWSSYLLIFFMLDSMGAHLGLSFEAILAAFVFSALGMALPSTPGSIGVYEAGIVFALGLFGVPKEDAFVFGFTIHMFQMVPTVAAAMYLMLQKNISLKSIKR